MIYSDTFVWLHFPKCAGTKVERLFAQYYSDDERITQDVLEVAGPPPVPWHDSVAQREARDPKFKLGNRMVICSFRRLPAWLESRYSYENHRSPQLDHSPERLLEGKFLEQHGNENHADRYAMRYLPKILLESGKVRFIRTEYFESDFKSVFSDYIDISIIPDGEFNQKVNVSKDHLQPEFRKKLYENLPTLYEKCPYWKMVEEVAYGHIL